jgi:site-specific DNA-methyltransferase (adenine-specific)
MHSPYVEEVPNLPEEVMIEAIDLTTKEGDTILDCFMGTGQTGIAALTENRKFIGIELSADKVALAQRRLSRLT